MHDFSSMTDDEIETWIFNHERKRATHSQLYGHLVEERNRRHGQGLSLDVSIPFIIRAAKKRRFVSYGDLAEVNKQEWAKVRYPMNKHLGDIISYSRNKGWPPLTAIVVNGENVETGDMEQTTLKGFVEAARWLGYDVADPAHLYLRKCQKDCFSWFAKQSEQRLTASGRSVGSRARSLFE